MEEKKNILTREGLKRYEDELHELKVIRRKEVAQKIKEAREQGDLSENAEYDARIEELEKILKNVEVVDEEDVTADRIMIGSRVRIYDVEFDEELSYKIVGSTEANSIKGKISNESPVGKALIGAHVGDTVTVHTPAGESAYRVLEITAPNR